MNDWLSPLQGGRTRRGLRRRRSYRARRPPRGPVRWRVVGFVVLGVVVLGGVLLGITAGRANGPTKVAFRRTHTVRSATGAPVRGEYGITPAPATERVSVTFGHGLRSGLLFDVATGQVLWELNPTDVLPIASLTKMMTALVVVAHSHPTDQVLITPQAVHFTGSGVGLLPLHKRVSELALLYGLLLPSGNDAAIALAQHVAGTQAGLIAMMNARAQQLGLGCTHFTTVSGVIDQGNHSCAADLALMAHEVLEQRLLAKIVGSRSAILPFPIKGGKLFLYNNNPLLIVGYPGADGVKTGFTTAAGPCLIATARRGSAWLGVVLLHSVNTLAEAERLLNAGFAKLRAV
jgi:serine-type D-Ala-D-Ala carboxypeptidase (penicillin-binding protein 5/6)